MTQRTLALSVSMTLVILMAFYVFMNSPDIRSNRAQMDDPDSEPIIFRPETTHTEYQEHDVVDSDLHKDKIHDTGDVTDSKDETSFPSRRSILLDWETDNSVHSCTDGSKLRKYDNIRTRDLSPDYKPSAENDAHRKKSFTEIFKDGQWSHKESEGALVVSGPGSLFENTANIRRILNTLIDEIKLALGRDVVRMLDIPCGDFTWMRHFVEGRSDIMYTGMDIVPDLIRSHSQEYRDWKNVRFINQDVVAEPLPEQFDLILSRHMTIHLTNADTLKVLQHFSENNHGFLLMTSYPVKQYNKELDVNKHRRFRCQNLEKEPFSLPPPICEDTDAFEGFDVAALWRLPLKQVME